MPKTKVGRLFVAWVKSSEGRLYFHDTLPRRRRTRQSNLFVFLIIQEAEYRKKDGFYEWLPHIARTLYFRHVGANIGEWTEVLLKYSGSPKKGILYEPSPTVFKKLTHKLANHKKLIFRQVAVGENKGQATLHENPKSTKVSSLISPRGTTKQTQVNIVSLDQDLSELGIEKVDFLKIDAEGYDFQVLKGAFEYLQRQSIGLIQFEYSRGWIPASSTLKAAMRYLESFGYEVLLLKSDGLYSLNYEWYGEYFQYSNFLAISSPWRWIKESLYRGVI